MIVGHYSVSTAGVLTPCTPTEADRLIGDEQPRMVAPSRVGTSLISTTFVPVCLTFEDGRTQAFASIVERGHKAVVVARYSDLADDLNGHDREVARNTASGIQGMQ